MGARSEHVIVKREIFARLLFIEALAQEIADVRVVRGEVSYSIEGLKLCFRDQGPGFFKIRL